MRVRSGGKRGFKRYSSAKFAGWDRPGGGGEPGDPYELTMNSVRLRNRVQPFGMDETRKRAQRRMLWYWQYSRDWDWRRIATVSGLQPEKASKPGLTVERPEEKTKSNHSTVWYWAWPNVKKRRSKKKTLPMKSTVVPAPAKRGGELLEWLISLNQW